MTAITAALVKELREKTGAGMMNCKTALTETDGDMEAAVDWLRAKGLAAAAKKASRVAAEGLVGIAASDDGLKAAVIEVNSETDFVARNDDFQSYVEVAAGVTLGENGDLDAVKAAKYPGAGESMEETLTNLVARIGENLSIRRAASLTVGNGAVATYMHNAQKPGLGKIGVIVALESAGDKDALQQLGKQIAMHVAAASPLAISQHELDPTVVERERQVQIDKAKESGRPDNVIEKMVEGRMRKFFEESCLLEQVFVMDNETPVGKVLENEGKTLGADIKLIGFVRFALGEGIEKKEDDFAAEVAAAAGTA